MKNHFLSASELKQYLNYIFGCSPNELWNIKAGAVLIKFVHGSAPVKLEMKIFLVFGVLFAWNALIMPCWGRGDDTFGPSRGCRRFWFARISLQKLLALKKFLEFQALFHD